MPKLVAKRVGLAGAGTGALLLCLAGIGCTESNPLLRQDGGAADQAVAGDRGIGLDGPSVKVDGTAGGDKGGQGGIIKIYVKGDLTQGSFSDGLSGQTPTNYVIALSRYQILTSAADPKPILCFDHGKKPFEVDVYKDNQVGFCRTKNIKSGVYTHGRTRVDWSRYTVNGAYHLGIKYPGKFTFFRAYSDTTYKGKAYKAGHGFISFSGVTTASIPFVYGPLPSVPGVQFVTKNGEFTMTFRYTKPLPIVQTSTKTHWARFHWKIKDSFRWSELKLPGYQKGTWDVAALATGIEPVLLHGVAGYYVTSSAD